VDVRFRVTPDDRALNFHLRLRLPYSDLKAAGKVVVGFLHGVAQRGS